MKLLLLLLLTTTGVWGTPNDIDCLELYEILREAVKEEYINEQEAQSIYKRCAASTTPASAGFSPFVTTQELL